MVLLSGRSGNLAGKADERFTCDEGVSLTDTLLRLRHSEFENWKWLWMSETNPVCFGSQNLRRCQEIGMKLNRDTMKG